MSRRAPAGRLLCALPLCLVSACTSSLPPAEPALEPAGKQSPDFGEPYADKRSFLRAVRRFGYSPGQDIALLNAMTSVKLSMTRHAEPFRDAQAYELGLARVPEGRLASSVDFQYAFNREGEYMSASTLRLRASFACITIEDLRSSLGAHASLSPAPLHPEPPGTTNVWGVIYVLPSGARAHFRFDQGECALALGIGVRLT